MAIVPISDNSSVIGSGTYPGTSRAFLLAATTTPSVCRFLARCVCCVVRDEKRVWVVGAGEGGPVECFVKLEGVSEGTYLMDIRSTDDKLKVRVRTTVCVRTVWMRMRVRVCVEASVRPQASASAQRAWHGNAILGSFSLPSPCCLPSSPLLFPLLLPRLRPPLSRTRPDLVGFAHRTRWRKWSRTCWRAPRQTAAQTLNLKRGSAIAGTSGHVGHYAHTSHREFVFLIQAG
eukprot:2994988-Rhodomonas_salina.1